MDSVYVFIKFYKDDKQHQHRHAPIGISVGQDIERFPDYVITCFGKRIKTIKLYH